MNNSMWEPLLEEVCLTQIRLAIKHTDDSVVGEIRYRIYDQVWDALGNMLCYKLQNIIISQTKE